ncbi:MAG: hypothetical protein JWO62_736 [Acidimicrobiaceae bacterium]|jgi:uncharacterized protein CbrC (UPF0167 family)|nr:hypothetical protein [Acidimicrobiaceae bacterium]
MTVPLPVFRYHPDPVATGSVETSTVKCVACEKKRGYVYVGPVYRQEDSDDNLCPWCIADGTAASKFDAAFTDVGWGVPDDVPASVLDEVSRRTPGFQSLQQDHWLYHCRNACAFLGQIGRRELENIPEALDMLLHENDRFGWNERQSREHVDGLVASGEATHTSSAASLAERISRSPIPLDITLRATTRLRPPEGASDQRACLAEGVAGGSAA